MGTGGTQSLTAPAQLDLGTVPSGGGFLTGDIAEVKIFNTALADLNRQAEENALACEYGLNLNRTALAAPARLNGTPGNRQITLNWSGSSGAASYSLTAATNLTGPFNLLVSGLATNSFTDASAVSGQTRYYEVSAANGCNSSTSSTPIAVFLPKPALTLVAAGANALNLGWPAWANDWALYYATNLNPPVIWYPNTNAVGSNDGQFTVSLPITAAPRFYRLTAP
jgi:hypothetical protein